MEWSNAKKFVIVLLVLLNVLLAGLNYKQNRENTMTAAQERSIFEVHHHVYRPSDGASAHVPSGGGAALL